MSICIHHCALRASGFFALCTMPLRQRSDWWLTGQKNKSVGIKEFFYDLHWCFCGWIQYHQWQHKAITYMELEYLVAIGIIPSLHSAPTANNQICASEASKGTSCSQDPAIEGQCGGVPPVED